MFDKQLSYLSWHGIQHELSRIIWFCDLLEIIQKEKEQIDWPEIHKKSIDYSVEGHFLFCMHLLDVIFCQNILSNKQLARHGICVKSMLRHNISEKFYLKIQNAALTKKCYKQYRRLLYLVLMD
jgi:hypothetical protein